MSAQAAIDLARTSKVNLVVTSAGNLGYEGDQHSVDQLLPLIKRHKAKIIQMLSKSVEQDHVSTDPNLKPCPLCKGLNFTHGNRSGYFCTSCQPGHEGTPVLASGKRPDTDLKGYDSGLSMSVDSHNAQARTPKEKTPSSFAAAHKWILQHRQEVLGAGWRPPELYRRNKSRGIAWLGVWGKPAVDVNIGRNGEIVFYFRNTTGKKIQQTAFPRRHYGNK